MRTIVALLLLMASGVTTVLAGTGDPRPTLSLFREAAARAATQAVAQAAIARGSKTVVRVDPGPDSWIFEQAFLDALGAAGASATFSDTASAEVVVGVNGLLTPNPFLANRSPYGSGWAVQLEPRDPIAGLLVLRHGALARARVKTYTAPDPLADSSF